MRYFVLTFIFVLVGLAGLSAYRSLTTETGTQTKPATGGIQDVAGITVQMLNTRDDGVKMIYSQDVLRVDVGDTVTWLPTDLGHNVEFVAWPEGFEKPKASKLSEPFTWTFDLPGVYVYLCTPHVKAGMVAIVVVGDDVSNKNAVSELELFGESVPRLEQFLAQI